MDIQKRLQELTNKMDDSYKTFLKAPTENNLAKFIHLGEQYRDAWILSNSDKLNENDMQQQAEEVTSGLVKRPPLSETPTFLISESNTLKRKPIRMLKETIGRADSNLKLAGKNGGSSIITNYCFSSDANSDIDYFQHSIVGTRSKDGKLFNRRWYFEKGKSGKVEPWWTDRIDFSSATNSANERGMFSKEFHDNRMKRIEIIHSDDLSNDAKLHVFKDITIPEERMQLLEEDINFVIVESNLNKTHKQILNNLDNIKWRDVCIYSPERITFRSLTNDKTHKPSVRIIDNPSWLISNDMCNTSNQAMIHFLKFTDRKLKIKEGLDDN